MSEFQCSYFQSKSQQFRLQDIVLLCNYVSFVRITFTRHAHIIVENQCWKLFESSVVSVVLLVFIVICLFYDGKAY